jgi:photosystem II stability/assembly factor-like uncharacterized protein
MNWRRCCIYPSLVIIYLSTIAVSQILQEKEHAELKHQRDKWYLLPRATIGANAYELKMKSLQQMAEMNGAITSGQSWKSIGPTSVNFFGIRSAGATSGLAVDPRNSNVVYASFAGGGLWKTADAGNSWVPLTDQQPIMQTSSFSMDPNNPDVLYVGASGGPDGGILKSADGGQTWSVITGPFVGPFSADRFFGGGASIRSIAIQPNNSDVLLVGTEFSLNGVFRSVDGGKTWKQVLTNAQGRTVLFDPTNGSTAYASLCNGSNAGIFKSFDGGATWIQLSNGLPASEISSAGDCGLAISSSNPNILAVAFNHSTRPTIFRTLDGGQHWASLTPAPDNMHAAGLFFSPSNPNVIFAGSAQLFRSVDGGASWQDVTTGTNGVTIHPDQNAFAFVGTTNQMFVGNDGGVFLTSDASAPNIEWTNLNNGLATLRIYPGFSIHPTNPNITFAGTQDEGTMRYSGLPDWQTVTCGDSSYTAVDQNNPANVYVDCFLADVQRSTDGGNTFVSAANGINASDPMVFFPPLVLDPMNGAALYFGTNRVYVSTDHAATWKVISPTLGLLNSISVSPKDPNTVFAADSTKVWTSINALAGAGWSASNTGLPGRTITRVIADPHDAHTVYVTLSGFSGFGDNAGHVFRSTNTGQSWVDISGNLPNIGANDLAIDPDVPGTLFLANDIGVFTTSNGGTTWQTLSAGLPINVVFGIRLHQPTRTLRATTFGRGAWDLAVPIPTQDFSISASALSPAAVSAGASATSTLTIAAANGFNGSVSLACTSITGGGTPAPTCSLNPNSVADGSGTSTLTVSTRAPTAASAGTPAGNYTVTVSATSGSLTHSQSITLTVRQAPVMPPVANAGPNQTVECSGHNGTPVTLDGSRSTDPDGDNLTYLWKNSGGTVIGNSAVIRQTLGVGTFTFSLTVTDTEGLSSTANITVVVHDTKPPTIANLSTTPKRLRKHNHKMVPVAVNYTSKDQCSATVRCSLAVSSSEPKGPQPEWRILDAHHVLLRAERLDAGKGRTYTITTTCADPSGNKTSQKVTVIVPHNHEEEDEDETEGHSD